MNLYSVKRVLRTTRFGRSKLYLSIRFYAKKNEIDGVINKYLGHGISPEYKKHIKKKMKEAMINYRWDFDEFFIFHYEEYDDAKRRSFVSEFDKNIFADLVNEKNQADVFMDKWATYKYFKDFFGRDVYNIRSLSDLDNNEFALFVETHPKFMMKPAFGTRGAGIQVLNVESVFEAKDMLTGLYHSGVTAMMLEELIVQDDKLAALHPESVNTLRVITIKFDDRVEVIRSFLRIGKGSSFIDNTSAGGILALIDVKSGKICAACDRLGHTFEKHPDSEINLIGFEIPRWGEVIELVKQAAQVLPKVRYLGWDVAVTKTGCVLIEGNDKAQCGYQIPKQEGFRNEMNAILRELGKKEIN